MRLLFVFLNLKWHFNYSNLMSVTYATTCLNTSPQHLVSLQPIQLHTTQFTAQPAVL